MLSNSIIVLDQDHYSTHYQKFHLKNPLQRHFKWQKPPGQNSTNTYILHWMLCLKQENISRLLNINFFENCQNSKYCHTVSPLDHIRKPRCQTKHCIAAILQHNNKLTSGMCFSGFQWAWVLCASLLLLSFITLFFIQQNHVKFSNQHLP